MKKIIIGILVTALVLGLYMLCSEPAQAAEKSITANDVVAVCEQLAEYEDDIDVLAKVLWGEARGVKKTSEQAAVAWCVLNRVDADKWADNIIDVATEPAQFAYSHANPVTDELRSLAQDVVVRWLLEKRGISDVGRVLPEEYVFFGGRGGRNWFRVPYESRGRSWRWTLPSPYKEEV